MGALAHFDVGSLMARYGLLHFVEAGTGRGEGLAHAARFAFRTLRSCEVLPALAEAAAEAFAADRRVTVFRNDSAAFLRVACTVVPQDEPILFWLDAHFPGADYGLASYGAEPDEAARLPLPYELEAIRDLRPAGTDIILCDDLRVWVDGPYGSGNLPADVRPWCPKERGAGFFARTMGATHEVRFDFAGEGYAVLMPKETADG